MSSRRRLILVEEAVEGSVPVGVVGGVGGPAGPDDVDPGSGEDANGVGVVVSAVTGLSVEVSGPEVGFDAVADEVAQSVAELFVRTTDPVGKSTTRPSSSPC